MRKTEGNDQALASPDAYHRRLLDEAAARADELRARVVEALVTTPALGRVAATREQVRAAVAVALPLYLDAVRERRPLTAAETAELGRQAAALAATGVDGADLAHRMEVGSQQVWDFLGELGSGLPASREVAVEGLGRLFPDSTRFFAQVTEAVGAAYRAHHDREVVAGARARQELVDEVLTPSPVASAVDHLMAQAAGLGHDLARPHGLLVVAGSERRVGAYLRRLGGKTSATRASGDGMLEGSRRAQPRPHVPVLVAAPSDEAWAGGLEQAAAGAGSGVLVVAVGPLTDLGHAPTAYQQAVDCLEVAVRLGRTGVVRPEELTVEQIVVGFGSLEAHRVWNPAVDRLLALPAERRERLLRTLAALWKHKGNITKTAEEVSLSDRSVRRHLEDLQEDTGFDPDNPADRWRLDLARHALTVFADEAGCRTRPWRSS